MPRAGQEQKDKLGRSIYCDRSPYNYRQINEQLATSGQLNETLSASLTAEFEGTHGWYWKNDNAFPAEVTLNLNGDYTRMDIPVDQATAGRNAQAAIRSLVARGKLDKSWKSISTTSAETIEFNGKPEWKIIFDNEKIADTKKQRLYVFLKITGEHIAANYSGK